MPFTMTIWVVAQVESGFAMLRSSKGGEAWVGAVKEMARKVYDSRTEIADAFLGVLTSLANDMDLQPVDEMPNPDDIADRRPVGKATNAKGRRLSEQCCQCISSMHLSLISFFWCICYTCHAGQGFLATGKGFCLLQLSHAQRAAIMLEILFCGPSKTFDQ